MRVVTPRRKPVPDAWITKLKAGDLVIYHGGGWGECRQVLRVEKVTPTFIVKCKLYDRLVDFNSSGRQTGVTGWDRPYITAYSKKEGDEINRNLLIERLKGFTGSEDGQAKMKKRTYKELRAAAEALGVYDKDEEEASLEEDFT